MKKGFVLMETLVVVSVLTISLIGMYALFASALLNFKTRRNYDNVSDLYKVNIIRNLIPMSTTNALEEETNIYFDLNNCTTYMDAKCPSVLDSFNVEKIVVTNQTITTIMNSNNSNIPNTMVEYMRTIYDKEDYYIIVSFNRKNELYYASLKWKDNDWSVADE